MEKFAIGLLLGAVGGAMLAANSCKMRMLVRKGQEEVKQRLDEMWSEKLKLWKRENSLPALPGRIKRLRRNRKSKRRKGTRKIKREFPLSAPAASAAGFFSADFLSARVPLPRSGIFCKDSETINPIGEKICLRRAKIVPPEKKLRKTIDGRGKFMV